VPPARCNRLLAVLLFLCIARLWLMPLPSSFWLDEMATIFVVRHGAGDPSLAVAAPQAWRSLYYYLPRAAQALLGFSEIAYRLPSILAMAAALFFIARLAAKLIHPHAGWFAAFACLALGGINYEAGDARPYALGISVAAASLYFLVSWLDAARWRDALLFVILAATLWRVHLLFWPMYLVFALYALVRQGTATNGDRQPHARLRVLAIFAVVAAALTPVLLDALTLYREARVHAFAPPPGARQFAASLKWPLLLACGGGAWMLARALRWKPEREPLAPAAVALIAGWWLCQPLCLGALSQFTAASVFVPRYLALSLPGAALAATAAASRFIPAARWKRAAAILAIGALAWLGQWRHVWPAHHNSDWRGAAHEVNRLATPATPVICPSPFVEAMPPVWHPGYPLSGFLYAHLAVYPVRGRIYGFPFASSAEADEFAQRLTADVLARSDRFVIYGWLPQANFWMDWFRQRPELAEFQVTLLGPYRDVEVILFERPAKR
jgi:Dolichyl-phosphate-mannose-protein mannosyltransferase